MNFMTILKNAGLQKTANTTAPFSMGSLNLSGFDGPYFHEIIGEITTFRGYEKHVAYDSDPNFR